MTTRLPRVLVAEDDASIRKLLATTLRRRRFDVYLANDGAEALTLLQQETWDVVLLDLMMPHVNGWELVRWVQKHPERRPRSLVVMSAAGPDVLRDLDPTIVNAIFFKPFDLTQLAGYVTGAARLDGRDRRRKRTT